MPFTYGELQAEMDMINRAYIEVMMGGDAKGRVFTFPIPTYNMTPDFDWEHPNTDLLFEMTAKYGLPYFQNFARAHRSDRARPDVAATRWPGGLPCPARRREPDADTDAFPRQVDGTRSYSRHRVRGRRLHGEAIQCSGIAGAREALFRGL